MQGRQVSGCNCRTDDERPGRAGWTQRLMGIACAGSLQRGGPAGVQEIGL